jgi:prepilin-type N-terminal cleavage/methylation domain-containing protein
VLNCPINMKTSRYQRKGFTLIELLVVVGALAFLSSLLMAASARAKGNAQQVVSTASSAEAFESQAMTFPPISASRRRGRPAAFVR